MTRKVEKKNNMFNIHVVLKIQKEDTFAFVKFEGGAVNVRYVSTSLVATNSDILGTTGGVQ